MGKILWASTVQPGPPSGLFTVCLQPFAFLLPLAQTRNHFIVLIRPASVVWWPRPARCGPVREPTMEEKIPLSVAIITKNEAVNLPGCLESVAFANQIVVVDSGSDDGTPEIARRFGCEVFLEPWRGFGAQKQAAIDRCREPWVLVLDADERIPPETQAAIRSVIAAGEGAAPGYSFPRKNFFQGRWIRHMGWWPDRITRLFRRGMGRMTEASVHEAVTVTGPGHPSRGFHRAPHGGLAQRSFEEDRQVLLSSRRGSLPGRVPLVGLGGSRAGGNHLSPELHPSTGFSRRPAGPRPLCHRCGEQVLQVRQAQRNEPPGRRRR